MQKPYTTEIIELMAARSDLSAAYASAMMWDYKRRLKVEDAQIDWRDYTKCPFCIRFLDKNNPADCPLYKIFGNCCHWDNNVNVWQRTKNAIEAQDQQAFTTAANDLYYLIVKIIDDLYKPEPKKEVFYHVGQHFKLECAEYMLAEIGMNEVVMINIKGTSIWGTRTKINNPGRITEEEFAKIVCSRAFTLIDESKK